VIILFKPKLIIYAYGSSPNQVIGRSQQTAIRLAKKTKVLYLMMNTIRQKKQNRLKFSWAEMQENENLIIRYTPLFLPLSNNFSIIRKINGLRVALLIKKYLNKVNIAEEEVLFLAYTPLSAEVLKFFPKFRVHYDCADDFTTWHGLSDRQVKIYRKCEEYLLSRAKTVSTASKHMERKFKKVHDCVFRIPNGVEVKKFSVKKSSAELDSFPRPIIGFVGATSEFLDVELIKYLAKKREDYSFIFVGPLEELKNQLKNLKNVYFLGRKSYEDLPAYINSFDVCIIPANKKPASIAADAAKLYQYLATGKPVVTTNLPEVLEHSEYIYISDNKEGFLNKIEEALEENDLKHELRKKYSLKFDWDNTVDKLYSLFTMGRITNE
jgi:glycosyltransferase involved in cell wall biosynthesis